MQTTYDKRRLLSTLPTNSVVAAGYDFLKSAGVFDTDELLSRLEQRGVRNVDIAKALKLPDSRVPEIKRKTRALKLDEAATLVRTFGLEPVQAAEAMPLQILRLAVLHVGRRLGVSLRDEQVADLAADLRAFSEYAADPKVRGSLDLAEGFFQALERVRRPLPEEEVRQRTGHEPTS